MAMFPSRTAVNMPTIDSGFAREEHPFPAKPLAGVSLKRTLWRKKVMALNEGRRMRRERRQLLPRQGRTSRFFHPPMRWLDHGAAGCVRRKRKAVAQTDATNENEWTDMSERIGDVVLACVVLPPDSIFRVDSARCWNQGEGGKMPAVGR